MTYLVCVNDLRCNCHIGITEEERSKPQEISLSLKCKTSEFVCYGKLREILLKRAGEKPWELLEDLGKSCLADVGAEYPGIVETELEIKKYFFPDCESTSITLCS